MHAGNARSIAPCIIPQVWNIGQFIVSNKPATETTNTKPNGTATTMRRTSLVERFILALLRRPLNNQSLQLACRSKAQSAVIRSLDYANSVRPTILGLSRKRRALEPQNAPKRWRADHRLQALVGRPVQVTAPCDSATKEFRPRSMPLGPSCQGAALPQTAKRQRRQ